MNKHSTGCISGAGAHSRPSRSQLNAGMGHFYLFLFLNNPFHVLFVWCILGHI